MDHTTDAIVKIVGEDEAHISTINGTGLIETTMGAHIVKVVAVDCLPASVEINVTDVPQVIQILLTPVV